MSKHEVMMAKKNSLRVKVIISGGLCSLMVVKAPALVSQSLKRCVKPYSNASCHKFH